MSHALAFDYGTRSVGVAVGSELTGSASPLPAVRVRAGRPLRPENFVPIFERWHPAYIVVGCPLNMDGSEQELTRMARRFGRRLAAYFAVELHFADERLTTVCARSLLFERGGWRRLNKSAVDSLAAAMILEGFWSGGCGLEDSGMDGNGS